MQYSIRGYGEMFADRNRFDAYRSALAKAVRPGATVLDLGAGPCMLGLWACHYGAARVIAVDHDSSLGLGQAIVQESGFLPRFEFLNDFSTNIETPVLCDVVVSDLRGVLPLYGRHIPSIIDARQRWLAEGGRLIPECDTIHVAIVSSEKVFDEHYSAWGSDVNGWSLAPARRLLANSSRKINIETTDLLSSPALWMTLDYRHIASSDHQAAIQWTLDRDGAAHGLAVWFESELFDGVRLSNRPGHPKLIYGQMFFPWPERVPLCAGDSVEVRLRARLVNDDYIWSWNTRIDNHDEHRSGPLEFQQSTFQGQSFSPDQLSRMRLDAAPVLLPKGQATLSALAAMNGRASMHEIASMLAAELPDQFPRAAQAVKFVSALFGQYWR